MPQTIPSIFLLPPDASQSIDRMLRAEILRVQNGLMPVHQSSDTTVSAFSVVAIRADLDEAARALAVNDVDAMWRAHYRLRGWG